MLTRYHTMQMILVVAGVLASPCLADLSAGIEFDRLQIDDSRWSYTYTLSNLGTMGSIEEFTIWFDSALYRDLAIESDMASWSELVVQSDPWCSLDGYYDALTLDSGIAPGQSEGGFSVSFRWLGSGDPGVQPFEVVDPVTFETLFAGETAHVPEPAGALLLGIGAIAGICRRRR